MSVMQVIALVAELAPKVIAAGSSVAERREELDDMTSRT